MVASSPAALMVVVIAGCGASASRPPAAPDSSHPPPKADVTITTEPAGATVSVYQIDPNGRSTPLRLCVSPCHEEIPATKVRVEAAGISREVELAAGKQRIEVYRGSRTLRYVGAAVTVAGALTMWAAFAWMVGYSDCGVPDGSDGVGSRCPNYGVQFGTAGFVAAIMGAAAWAGSAGGVDVVPVPQRASSSASRLQLRPGPVTSVVVEF